MQNARPSHSGQTYKPRDSFARLSGIAEADAWRSWDELTKKSEIILLPPFPHDLAIGDTVDCDARPFHSPASLGNAWGVFSLMCGGEATAQYYFVAFGNLLLNLHIPKHYKKQLYIFSWNRYFIFILEYVS